MLWIEKYRPQKLSEILGQEAITTRLSSFVAKETLPHLLLSGSHGTGKTTTIECVANELYSGHAEENLTIIETGDMFQQGKRYLENKEKFSHIYEKDKALIWNFKKIVKEFSRLKPLDTEFKILVFEGAEKLPRDAQQALRRMMESTYKTCRFVFVTSNPSAIIPALSSRCLPFFFLPHNDETIIKVLLEIIDSESVPQNLLADGDTLPLIARASNGDLRKAVLILEALFRGGSLDLLKLISRKGIIIAESAFSAMMNNDYSTARRKIETLMLEYGYSAQEVLQLVRRSIELEYYDPHLICLIADTDYRLCHANNEYIHMNDLVAHIARRFFNEKSAA